MSESAGDNTPATPAPSYKKTKKKSTGMIITAVIVIVALVAGYFVGAMLNEQEETKDTTLNKILTSGELVVGTNIPWYPFEDKTDNGTYIGVDMDIVKEIAERLGVTLVIKEMSFDALIGAVESGQIDIAISSFTITAERAKSIDFSTPYYVADQAVLVKDSSTVTSPYELNGTTVGAQDSTTGAFWTEENLDCDGITYPDISGAVAALDGGIVDAVILDTPVADRYAADTHYSFKVAAVIHTNEQYGIVMPKDNPSLKHTIDTLITAMQNDGTMESIFDTYLGN